LIFISQITFVNLGNYIKSKKYEKQYQCYQMAGNIIIPGNIFFVL
jgi:hypothetical protein